MLSSLLIVIDLSKQHVSNASTTSYLRATVHVILTFWQDDSWMNITPVVSKNVFTKVTMHAKIYVTLFDLCTYTCTPVLQFLGCGFSRSSCCNPLNFSARPTETRKGARAHRHTHTHRETFKETAHTHTHSYFFLTISFWETSCPHIAR